VLSLARFCVAVDSAAFTASRAVGTPTLVLAGPSRPGRVPGPAPMVVVNRASGELKEAIARSRQARFSQGGCQNWDCPMAGLREIAVPDVLTAVEGQRHLLQDSSLTVGTRA
jgi:ADP-heptose:LPS heptosyltransferase